MLELTFYCFSLGTLCFIAFRVIFFSGGGVISMEYLFGGRHTLLIRVSVFNALKIGVSHSHSKSLEFPPHKCGDRE